MKKIGIVSEYNPHSDKKAHSGILYKINEAIVKAGFETVWIENKKSKRFSLAAKFCTLLKMCFNVQIYMEQTVLGAKWRCSTIDKKALEEVDYIMAIHYFHVPFALKTTKPIIYHSDATFELANNYYYHNVMKWNARQGEKIEKESLFNTTYHLSSSAWRDKSVREHYAIPAEKCFVLEYGPCIDIDKIHHVFSTDGVLRLLFLGVEWKRKGGEIAVETCRLLNERGIKAVIRIVGIKKIPESCKGKSYVDFVGYLNKNKKNEYDKLLNILQTSDLMIFPTHAEGAGIVFCECSAMGVPVLTYDTGGVANYIVNGINGYRLSPEQDASGFAQKVHEMLEKKELPILSKGGIRYAHEHLNWDNWSVFFRNILGKS